VSGPLHPHDHARADAGRRLGVVLGLTATYMVVQAAVGVLSGSLALLADAAHMLADVAGLTMAVLAVRFARRAPTPARTYGFYRAEVLAALANSVLLFAIAVGILHEAWGRFWSPVPVEATAMLGAAAGGLVVNLIALGLLRRGTRESLNVRGALLEVVADLLGSAGAVAAAVIVLATGWTPADPVVSAGIALLIVPRAWRLLAGTLDVLLEASPSHIDVAGLETAMRAVSGVVSVHDLHVWTITSGFVAMSGHVEVTGRRSREVLGDLQGLLREQFQIEHVTLQIERAGAADDRAACGPDPRCLSPWPPRRPRDGR
jgi:cobalt-zinc-cadmium efflux system protein